MAVGFDFNLLAARRRVAEALRAGPISAADSKRGGEPAGKLNPP